MPANSRPGPSQPTRSTAAGDLAEYRRKRKAGGTPEPFGGPPSEAPVAGSGLFIVQHHWASRLHYDFRLELGGVLVSWAITKGPSLDPDEKRMAIHVEDHPVEYAAFEGIIPPGNYGAGAVILWDRGRWVAKEDPVAGMEKGKLLFELYGFKLKGLWTLVRTTRDPKEWLLIKKPDAFADPGGKKLLPPESILSNRTVEQVKQGFDPAEELRAELERLGAPKRAVTPAGSMVMLAERRERAFTDPHWLYELKYDGYRLLASRQGGKGHLLYRSGRDATPTWPDVCATVAALPFEDLILDGEVVAFDSEGRTSFHDLQLRGQLQRAADIERAAVLHPCSYVVFDLLALEGYDLRPLPLIERKKLLRRVIPRAGPVIYADHIEKEGEALFNEIARRGLEGIMAKRMDAPYKPGRSNLWLKVPLGRRSEFAIVGYTDPSGGRTGFGALHLAVREGDGFLYAGSVGSGFDEKQLTGISQKLAPDVRPTPPCDGPEMPRGRENHWVEPKYVCEVQYRQWPEGHLVRFPVFLGLRPDKNVNECLKLGAPGDIPEPPDEKRTVVAEPSESREFSLTNLDKVFWPDEKITKGDLIEYYQTIAPWMLRYLRDRPVMLTRYPDGIKGKSFFQKDAPSFVPPWLRRAKMWSDENQREIEHFVCDDEESLVYLANLGTIPFHIWSSRVSHLQQPDWCILDLDPKGAPYAHVVRVARAIKSLCDDIELPCFAKTSGSTGLHVLIPLGQQLVHAQATSLAEVLARVIVSELPDIATIVRLPSDRGGRVYVDFLQNGHGKLLAAPFCVRPLPGAPVSTPLRWSEVSVEHPISEFTMRTVPERMKKLRKDPMHDVLTLRPDIHAALEKLPHRLTK
jgi:bifunctional non-homologous end joining protein LigD